ncbi:MFS transporter [Nakamurella deserti]|uniref:MFS transporter n=1 Tax=Nakamurella deserti TaxID=2164074 RepID=UPI000DBE6986|nr:MFS transporter [Nakamurella deserti]
MSDQAQPTTLTRRDLTRWRNAVFVIFALCGLAISTWLSRTPNIRDLLGATTAQMGWIVFGIAVGSIIGLLLSSSVLARFGPRRTIAVTLSGAAVGLVIAGIGATALENPVVVIAGLVVFGASNGAADVSMNVEGAANERALGRTVMPLFHAAFSGGTMAGAGLGALAEKLGVSVLVHILVVAVALVGGALFAVTRLQPHQDVISGDTAVPSGWRERMAIWRDRRTILIGLIVLGMAFAEGSANDWLALAMVDGHGVSNASGALILGVFLTAMTIGRIAGVKVLDRYGRVPVLRATAALAVVGLLVVIFAPTPIAVVGVVLWGLGASLGFPVGMSAAADDPATAGARVSAVATIGYVAFLVGPPLLGFLGDHFGLLNALLVVVALIVVAGLISGGAREPKTVVTPAGRPVADPAR